MNYVNEDAVDYSTMTTKKNALQNIYITRRWKEILIISLFNILELK